MSTCHRLRLRMCTRPTPSPRAVMQTGCKNARASSRLRVPQLHAAAGRLSPGTLAQWSEPVGNSLSRACLGPAPPLPLPGGGCRTGHPGLLPARFGLVVWIGVLEVRGWFPIQLQHDPGVQSPNHQSKPAIRGKLRRVPQKGQALRGQGPDLTEPAPARHFCNSGTNIFYHLIRIKKCIPVAREKHACRSPNTGRGTHSGPGWSR